MNRMTKRLRIILLAGSALVPTAGAQQLPHAIAGGYEFPNGWRLTPLGHGIETEDMVLNVSVAPDLKPVVALHSGFNPHGLVLVDIRSGPSVLTKNDPVTLG